MNMNTWYVYCPADTDAEGSRLKLAWDLGYEDACLKAEINRHRTGRPTNVADAWFDGHILNPQILSWGNTPARNRRASVPLDARRHGGVA